MSNLDFYCVSKYEDLIQHKKKWNKLWERTERNLFSSFEWISALLNAKKECNIQTDFHIWFLREYGRLTCIAPLKIEGSTVSFASNFQADYQDFIYENQDSCILMIRFLKDKYENNNFLLSDIPEQSQTPTLFLQNFTTAKKYISEICPYVQVSRDSIQCFMGHDYRRKKNKLMKEGDLYIEHLTDVKVILSHLPTMKNYFAQRWQDNKESNCFFEKFDDVFMREITRNLGKNEWVLLTVLYSRKKPIAYYYGFIHDDCYLFYRSAFNASYGSFSPGMIALTELFLYCSKNKITKFDFMRGDYPYKKRYTTKFKKNILLEVMYCNE